MHLKTKNSRICCLWQQVFKNTHYLHVLRRMYAHNAVCRWLEGPASKKMDILNYILPEMREYAFYISVYLDFPHSMSCKCTSSQKANRRVLFIEGLLQVSLCLSFGDIRKWTLGAGHVAHTLWLSFGIQMYIFTIGRVRNEITSVKLLASTATLL